MTSQSTSMTYKACIDARPLKRGACEIYFQISSSAALIRSFPHACPQVTILKKIIRRGYCDVCAKLLWLMPMNKNDDSVVTREYIA